MTYELYLPPIRKDYNAKNGYYDSLRGKQVSDACKAGVARMWEEIRNG